MDTEEIETVSHPVSDLATANGTSQLAGVTAAGATVKEPAHDVLGLLQDR
jgi:hypothetical protein